MVEQLAVPDVPEHGALRAAPEKGRGRALGIHLFPVRLNVLIDLLPVNHGESPEERIC
jgi:hypothetical protein